MRGLKILLIVICIFNLGWFWQSPLKKKNSEGNRLYSEGKIDEALSKYRDAQIENPDSPQLHYNIGSALHQKKNYEDALNEFNKAIDSKNTELQANAYYNLGNTHYRAGKLLEAIEDYKKCLDINPDDEDAKYNIEFIRKKLKEQLKKEEQKQSETQQAQQQAQQQMEQQEGQAQEKPQEEQEQAEEQSKKEATQEEKPGEEKKEQAQEKKLEELAQEEKEAKEKPKEGEMSKEDAIRLLDALKDDEKDLQRELRRQPVEGEYRVEKDW